ncbi:MAG: NAD(P)H-binding protein [Phycisphaerales bacterium]
MDDSRGRNAHNGEQDRGLVAVSGATGFVGRHAVGELLRRGWRVRGLTRTPGKARRVFGDEAIDSGRVQIVEGDALREGVADRLVRGADACVNLIGIIREAPGGQTFERMHTKTTRALVRACEQAGVPRFVQMSALGVGDDADTAYARTKWGAERAVRASSLVWTILRPGLIHGADGEFMREAKSWCEGRSFPHVFIPCFTRLDPAWKPPRPPKFEDPSLAPVRVEDVAWAIGESLVREAARMEVYNLVGPERVTMREMLESLRDALPLGKKLPVVGIPGCMAAAKARAAAAIGLRDALPFDEGMARMGSRDALASLDKASAHLSFQPAPFTETMRAYAGEM